MPSRKFVILFMRAEVDLKTTLITSLLPYCQQILLSACFAFASIAILNFAGFEINYYYYCTLAGCACGWVSEASLFQVCFFSCHDRAKSRKVTPRFGLVLT